MPDSTGYVDDSAGASQDELDEVLSQFRSRFKHAQSHWTDWRNEARALYDLMSGDQWSVEDEAKMKEELRPMVTFNVAGKYLDAVTGLQINNRQETRFFPRQMGNVQISEIMTGAVDWARDLCDQQDEETDAFYDCITCGLGWMECFIDKDLDASGVPCGYRVDPLEMYPDPAARKRNLEDARYVIRIRYMDHEDYKDIFGDDYSPNNPEFDTLDIEDEGIELIQQPQDYQLEPGREADTKTKQQNRPVADYQFWKREERVVVQIPGQSDQDLTPSEWEEYAPKIKKIAAQAGIKTQKIKRKVFYRALISGAKVGRYGLSPYQKGFTFHPITGKRDRNKNTWYGIGRSIMDPQKWVNKFFSTILFTLMTNAKGGIMAEENAFKDARKAESEWAKPDAITWLKEGSLSGAKPKVVDRPQARYPEGLDRLMEFSMAALPQTSGLNLELMGLADRVQAGVVEAQRKQSAMAIIAWAFDAMRRYYRSIGRQQAQYIIDYMPEGTLVMINGPDSKQYVPLVKSELAFKFDVTVDEAPTSVNQQERVWLVLEQMIPNLIKAGITIPPEVLDYAPLPSDLAQKWKQALKPDPQQQQLQARAKEAEVAKTEGEAQEKQTGAQLNLAQAKKALSDANALPLDQNTEIQGEIQKEHIKANADMQIAQVTAMVEMQIERMKAEMKAQTEILIAQMEHRLQQQQLAQDGALQQQQMAQDGAIAQQQMNQDGDIKREQMQRDTQLENSRIRSTEKVGMKKASQKPAPRK